MSQSLGGTKKKKEKDWTLDLTELFHFVFGNGGLLLQSCQKLFPFLGSRVRPS